MENYAQSKIAKSITIFLREKVNVSSASEQKKNLAYGPQKTTELYFFLSLIFIVTNIS